MRLLRPCRYDCEQNDLVDEENCGSFDCGLRIADSSCPRIRLLLRRLLRKTVHLLSIRNGQSAIRNSLRFAYPYVRAVVGIQAESIRRRADTYVGMRESPGASSTKKKTVRISRLPQG